MRGAREAGSAERLVSFEPGCAVRAGRARQAMAGGMPAPWRSPSLR